ncbi:MFS transporter [Lacticaseibacillus paracasei]|uniref:Lantibiotic efflux protein n=3 Tax=Lacticaseibacillus paracasei TaxID=1597 RepID=A0A829H7J6_LACPA|nr:MFS transporter [Lacticaseibacillus paracasei]EKQ18245.1 putative transport protein [Lacticaseibacillus casei UW4]EPC22343.1 Macrolide-efflux protein [Lacticaseibacillus paracasei subsp. paracasei Lpp22]EPC73413.1 Lantibiotic efflux protein [Lacticaseibacillus paracasei subsp. paracasei Lpp41]OJF74795.1 MFS transporter [Lacticaseibacillus casei]EKQ17955.1 putative transport protein [Lacticaseibacillus paracasei]
MHEYLTNRGYRAILNASLLSGIGDSLYNIVFIIYAATMPFKSLAVTLAAMATSVPTMLSLLTGSLADRTHAKTRHIVATRLGQMLLFLSLAVMILLPASFPLFLSLLLINIVSDSLGQYGNGLTLPLLHRLIPAKELNTALSFQSATSSTVQLVFQGLGASLIVLLNHNYALFGLLNALTFLLAAVTLVFRKKQLKQAEPPVTTGKSQPVIGNIRAVLKFLAGNQFLFAVILFAMLVNTLGSSVDGLMNITLVQEPDLWLRDFGTTVAIINVVFSVGLIFGALFAKDGLQRLSTFKLLSLLMAAIVGLSSSFFLLHSSVAALGFSFVTAYLMGKINPRLATVMMRQVPEQQMGTTAGVVNLAALIGMPVGQVIFFTIANLASAHVSWIVMAGLATGLFLVLIWMSTKILDPVFTDSDQYSQKA